MEFVGNHKSYNDLGNALIAGRPSTGGLPDNVLDEALSGYFDRAQTKSDLLARRGRLKRLFELEMPDVQVATFVRKSVSVAKFGTAISAYHVNAKQLDGSEGLFGAYTDAFVFRRDAVWHLQTNDPVVATGHLHRRAIQRSENPVTSLSEFHLALSTLWPAFIELGNRRREADEPGRVTQFAFPLWGGLAMAEMLKQADTPFHGPRLWLYEGGLGRSIRMHDGLTQSGNRLMVRGKTFLDLRSPRVESLTHKLAAFASHHSAVLTKLADQHQYALYGNSAIVKELGTILSPNVVSDMAKSAMLDDLDAITSSDLWDEVVAKSKSATSSEREAS